MTKQIHYKTAYSEEWHRIDYVRYADIDPRTRTLVVEVWDDSQMASHSIEIYDVTDYNIT